MSITFLTLLILSLASFRLTRLLVFDKIFEFIREPFFDEVKEEHDGEVDVYYVPKKTGIKKFIGELLSCYWCTGVWASAFIVGFYYICPDFSGLIILILAVAGLASLLELFVQYFIEK
ncbi:DUF1360 domain-containing protein [Neobacillus cucumis]|uniref:Sporulation protein n=1 Tax=Neobacillus cucumis TaxID=1740721 RepID=A0A2N5HBM3_9BACI|nr:DUF1360 domain-containing protein [Neobacillus cucumis]PLS02908.1 sporulation protein [Neobacillus cucumis]